MRPHVFAAIACGCAAFVGVASAESATESAPPTSAVPTSSAPTSSTLVAAPVENLTSPEAPPMEGDAPARHADPSGKSPRGAILFGGRAGFMRSTGADVVAFAPVVGVELSARYRFLEAGLFAQISPLQFGGASAYGVRAGVSIGLGPAQLELSLLGGRRSYSGVWSQSASGSFDLAPCTSSGAAADMPVVGARVGNARRTRVGGQFAWGFTLHALSDVRKVDVDVVTSCQGFLGPGTSESARHTLGGTEITLSFQFAYARGL